MHISEHIADARGLTPEAAEQLRRLCKIYNKHVGPNVTKKRYYEGHITLNEVNLGLALPSGLRNLEIGCAWGEKTVDVLASRSMFDGFVGSNGTDATEMTRIMSANNLRAAYMKACKDELLYGCTFATLTADPAIGCRIRFYSPESAAAEWSGETGRILAGFAIMDSDDNENPTCIQYHTDTSVWVLRRINDNWTAEEYRHPMGRPLMEPLVWNPTNAKPFGRSRLKEPIRRLIQAYVRTIANATIGLEFATSPQKYLLGITDDQYDALVNQKFRTYVGSVLAATTNPDTGEKPTFGQLSQGTIEPHVQMLRMLSTQFSAATGLSVTDVGVVNDANPTSSDAILAQTQTLILLAEQLNAGNGDSLYTISQMAQAIARNVTLEELTDEEREIMAHFKNPSMPSVAVTADAAIKIASARPNFAGTDVFAEMIGFDQADIRRIKAQEARARGLTLVENLSNDDT